MQFRDLRAQYALLQADINASVERVLEEGHYIGGVEVGELERRLATYVGVEHCITCGNGTDALQLALMAWGVGPGDAVLVPDFTFFASGEVVSAVGAIPVFVDVDMRTFNIDPAQIPSAVALAKELGLSPKAVIAVDLFGLPADYSSIRTICKENGLLLLEDGAQGFGGSIRGNKACSFGDISTTSFFPAKPLGCYGDGGAVFTDNDEWASLIRSLAVHGKGSMKYDNVRIGMNSRLDTMQAAILLVKLDAFRSYELSSVNQVAHWYNENLGDSDFVLPCVPEGYESSWAQYTVQIPKTIDRSSLQAALKDRGVPTMVYYPKPMHEQVAFLDRSLFGACEIASELCGSVLSLPMHPYLTEEICREIAFALKGAASRS